MQTLKMTASETDVYDHGSDPDRAQLMRRLRQAALAIAADAQTTVEICTNDGIVADVVYASDAVDLR